MRTYWVVPAGVGWVALIGVVFGQWWRWNSVQPTVCFAPCPAPPPDPAGQPWLSYALIAVTVAFGFALGRQRRVVAPAVLPLIGGVLPSTILPFLSTVRHPLLHFVLVAIIAALAVLAGYVLIWLGWTAGYLVQRARPAQPAHP